MTSTTTGSEPFRIPSSIPPRTSSHRTTLSNGLPPGSPPRPTKPAISESDWLSSSLECDVGKGKLAPDPQSGLGPYHTTQVPGVHLQRSAMSPSGPASAGAEIGTPPWSPRRSEEGTDEATGLPLSTWNDSKERILTAPYDYMFGHPGKDIRTQLIAAFNIWLQVPAKSLEVITKVVGMLHTASLLVDDVEDASLLRRGVPVAHSIFGTAQTINSANYIYFQALKELYALQSPRAIEIFTEELLNLHRGQGMDLFWRDTLTCPTEADYLEMVGNKTGGLFRLAIKLMQAESEVAIDCTPLVSTMGILFQILDDHLNLSSSSYALRKGHCEDLTEGKFSFPVIHAIRADPRDLVLVSILRQKTTDDEVKKFAVRYMEGKGSFQYTREVLEGLRAKAIEMVRALVDQVDALGGQGQLGGKEVMTILEKMKVE